MTSGGRLNGHSDRGFLGPFAAFGLGAALLGLSVSLAGCGDGAGYQLRIENGYPNSVVIVASGTAWDATGTTITDPAFVVRSGAAPTLVARVTADTKDDGSWNTSVAAYTADCRLLGVTDVGLGLRALSIDPSGAISVDQSAKATGPSESAAPAQPTQCR